MYANRTNKIRNESTNPYLIWQPEITARPTQKVGLTGTGTEVKLSPTSLSFGTLKVGNTSQPQTATVTNLSTVNNLTLSSIALGGTDPGDFLISSNTCPPPTKSLGPGQNCKVGVEFKPTATGARDATLVC